MKFILILFCSAALIAAVPVPDDIPPSADITLYENQAILPKDLVDGLAEILIRDNGNEFKANINQYADRVFERFSTFAIMNGLDPVKLDDVKEDIHYFLSFGSLTLTKGWLQGISSMKRGGDVIVRYDPDGANVVRVVVPVKFDVLSANYDYCAKIMYLGPCGGIEAKIPDLVVKFALNFDFNTYQAKLEYFDVVNSGHISLNISGNILFDWLWNLIANATTAVLKRVVLFVMQTVIRDPIKNVIQIINEAINAFLHPSVTTVAPTTDKSAELLINYLMR